MKATHLLQGLRQPDLEDLSICHVVKTPRKIKNFNVRQRRKKRAEAICTRLSCLKSLEDKECKSGKQGLEKTRENRFFWDGMIRKKALKREKKKGNKANIFEQGKNTKKYNAIKKEEENERRMKTEDLRRREKDGNDKSMLNLLEMI